MSEVEESRSVTSRPFTESFDFTQHDANESVGVVDSAIRYRSCLDFIQRFSKQIVERQATYAEPFILDMSVSAITAGVSATAIPAASSASIFPDAVPFPPETIAPA